jgi:hypothetical protein
MLKTALALFIIAHGLVHAILAIAPNPTDPNAKPGAFFSAAERSWLLSQLWMDAPTIRRIGFLLVGLSTLGFVLTGLGIFGIAGLSILWRTVAIISAGISLLLLITFWHRWLPIGVLIDVGTLFSLLVIHWPPVDQIGT